MAEHHKKGDSLAVEVRGVTKGFGSGEARAMPLKGVDFEARLGELLMIFGRSGCRKAALLSVIAGTLEFVGGEINIFDSRLHGVKNREVTEFRKQNVGFNSQQFNLIPTLSLVESVPLLISGMGRGAAEKLRALLDQLGIEGRGNDRPPNFSGELQRRVAIARALVHEPGLVICDKPTKNTGVTITVIMTWRERGWNGLSASRWRNRQQSSFCSRPTEGNLHH